jgi:spermidine/putrescine transport system ATP-binding protein
MSRPSGARRFALMEQTQPVVSLRGVTKRFDDVAAVDRLDLDIRDGEFLALLGPSGCGKTTTLRMIAGFEQPTEGEIHIGGTPVVGVPAHKREVNTVFQNYALFPHLDIIDNVAYGLKQRGIKRGERRQQAADALKLVHLQGRESARPSQLSGGQQQRVALARALVLRPKVLLLDEPLGALDQKLRKAMQIELKRLQADVGITFIFVTHDQEEALAMADRIAVMDQGRVEQLAPPRELYDEPATTFVAGFIGDMSTVTGTLSGDVVELPGGLKVPLGRRLAQAANGARVHVGLRPECGTFHPVATGAAANATVATAMVLGDRLQVLARVGDGDEVLLRQARTPGDDAAASLKPGDPLAIDLHPGAGLLLAQEGAEDRAIAATSFDDADPAARHEVLS